MPEPTKGQNSGSSVTTFFSTFKKSGVFEKLGLLITMILIAIIFTFLTGGLFLSAGNIVNIFVQTALSGIVAIGMTFVIITGGIDLSVGGTAVLTAVGLAMILQSVSKDNFVLWLASIIFIVVLGAAVGLINGLSITALHMVPFVTTLALMNITRGAAETMSNAATYIITSNYMGVFGMGKIIGIPVCIWMLVIATVIAFVLLNKTRYGREVYAVGGNPKAAWLAGIRIGRVIALAYVISGTCAGIGGILITSQLMGANSQIGVGMELQAIAACVIGGTSLMGGEGGVGGTIMGAIVIAMINIGLNLLGVSPFLQLVATGLVIFIVVAQDAIRRNRAQRI